MPWSIPDLPGFMPEYAGYSIPPKNNANYAFILSGLSKIDGKAVFLLPNSVLTPKGTELQIMKQIINENLLSAVIALPDGMFESTSIPVCMLVFDRHKQTRMIKMIDMRNCYEEITRDQNGQFGGASHTGRTYHKTVKVITDDQMKRAIDVIGNYNDIAGYCRTVSVDMIAEQDYILTPSRYIEQEAPDYHYRSFEDIAADYNRVIRMKNEIRIKMNRTAAKRLGYDCMDQEAQDLTPAFAVVGQKIEKEQAIRFSADDGIEIKCSTKDGIPRLIIMFLQWWKEQRIFLNNEENRYLAEFRDALLPKLMNGEIELEGDTQ